MQLLYSRAFLLAAVVVLLIANVVFFDAVLDANYLRWYVEAGAEISLALALISLAVDLDRFEGLIAADPREFARDCLTVIGLAVKGLPHLGSPRGVSRVRQVSISCRQRFPFSCCSPS